MILVRHVTETFEAFHARLRDFQARTWAGPVEQQAPAEAIELIELESWLDDELSCECSHVMTGKHNCQHTVTHFSTVKCTGSAKLVCVVAAQWNLDGIRSGQSCGNCGEPTVECWRVVKV